MQILTQPFFFVFFSFEKLKFALPDISYIFQTKTCNLNKTALNNSTLCLNFSDNSVMLINRLLHKPTDQE